MKKILSTIVHCLFFGLLPVSAEVLRDAEGRPVRYAGKFNASKIEVKDCASRKGEFRGIWVAVVENIDFRKHNSIQTFKKDFLTLLNNAKNAGFTAVIFQLY